MGQIDHGLSLYGQGAKNGVYIYTHTHARAHAHAWNPQYLFSSCLQKKFAYFWIKVFLSSLLILKDLNFIYVLYFKIEDETQKAYIKLLYSLNFVGINKGLPNEFLTDFLSKNSTIITLTENKPIKIQMGERGRKGNQRKGWKISETRMAKWHYTIL